MGCLNSTGNFDHWFGNIHLSGPCNRACYFCIGQHMMALDPLNVLNKWPLPGWDNFIAECYARNIRDVNLTGTNTDPLLYQHLTSLVETLRRSLPGVRIGLRTNGVRLLSTPEVQQFDKISISFTSADPKIYRTTMGSGAPPDLERIRNTYSGDLKVNIVLCPETIERGDFICTLQTIAAAGIVRVNLREPYGQPRIGDPMPAWGFKPVSERLGMPVYNVFALDVTYWDVHYVEVESVNLYANGRVSMDYPITRGHDTSGEVSGQEHFKTSGRIYQQWL